MSLCELLRNEARGLWLGLHEHPFLRELAAGTLPPERFRFYLEQDLYFLPDLARSVALGVVSADGEAELRHFAEEMVAVADREISSNRELLERVVALGAADHGGSLGPAPATVAYGGFLVATAGRGGSTAIMAALLPCTWSYADIAVELAGEIAPHPVYEPWVRYFASAEYVDLIAGRRRMLDDLTAAASDAHRRRLSEIFTMSARLEAAFWDMAYGLEQWPDLREAR